MKARVVAVIPARLGSRRFPRKVLYPWRGKPLMLHVIESVARSKLVDRLMVATDSPEVRSALTDLGVEVVMTSRRHRTGSDRVAEAVARIGREAAKDAVVINIQADCLGLSGRTLDRVVEAMRAERGLEYATLAVPIRDDDELFNPNAVKVVTARDGRALWFSRYPLPYLQHPASGPRVKQYGFLKHLGVYFFRRPALERYASWRRSRLEKAESLEQLRILENDRALRVFLVRRGPRSVDTPEDLENL